jgi:sensor histidine kinase YesM
MERLLRESQLVALQSQMNPHFLFNTLNSIARTAGIENASRSRDLIQGLSAVLRYILRNPRQSVSLNEEIRVVREYLSLQAVRFGSRLETEVVVDPDTESAHIPPLILQPLVENAVIYGIEPIENGGRVSIVTERERTTNDGERLTIRVSDNGAGMDSDTVAHLLQEEPDTGGHVADGIGVLNVRARLELFFGSNHLFAIHSAPGRGTNVTLSIPFGTNTETYGLYAPHS